MVDGTLSYKPAQGTAYNVAKCREHILCRLLTDVCQRFGYRKRRLGVYSSVNEVRSERSESQCLEVMQASSFSARGYLVTMNQMCRNGSFPKQTGGAQQLLQARVAA